MSLKDRLLRLAELELKNAARRVRAGADALFRTDRSSGEWAPDDPRWDELLGAQKPVPDSGHDPDPSVPAKIRRFYANLELPVGAPADEVKAAYRRLMRRYHPDRHASNPERAKLATQVAQELRTAYDGLIAYLGERA